MRGQGGAEWGGGRPHSTDWHLGVRASFVWCRLADEESVHEEEEKGSASLCLSSTEHLAHGAWRGCACVCVCVQSRNVCVCPERLSCFRRAIEGRHCYCSEGPEGPGMTAAHLGWPALEGAVRREDTRLSQLLDFPASLLSRIHIDSTKCWTVCWFVPNTGIQ